MGIARIIILCALCVFTVLGVVAESEMNNGILAINIVRSLLKDIKDENIMSYDDEVRYFGDQSILSHVVLLKFKFVDKAGHWISKDKLSLLGSLLKNNAALFSISGDAMYSCATCKTSEDSFYVSIDDVGDDEKLYFEKRKVCKSIVFHVIHASRSEGLKIDLSRSSINGIGVPALLGFSSEKQLVSTYGGKMKFKWIPVYDGVSPLAINNQNVK